MSKEKEFILYSADKKKLKFSFRLENNGKITIQAKQEEAFFPIIFEYSFTKEEFIEKTGVGFKEQERIFKEIISSLSSRGGKFALKESEVILCISILNGSFEIELPIPLVISNNLTINSVSYKFSRLRTLLFKYNDAIQKLANNINKKINTKLINKKNENLDKTSFENLFYQLNNEINKKFTAIQNTILQNQKETTLHLDSLSHQINQNKKFKNFFVERCVASLLFNPIKKTPQLQVVKSIQNERSVFDIWFLKDGRLVSGGGEYKGKNGRIVIYNKKNYEVDVTIKNDDYVFSICVLRNGNLASTSYKNIKIWEIDGNNYKNIYTLHGHSDIIWKIIELKNGKLCSVSSDKTIRIWDDKKNYECIENIKSGHTACAVSLIEMSDYIISLSGYTGEKSAKIWNKYTYKHVNSITSPYCYGVNAISKLRDNQVIVGGIEEIFIFDVLSFQSKGFRSQQMGTIHSICVLSSNKVLIGNNKGVIFCFDSLLNQIGQKFHNADVNKIIETEDNRIFSCSDGRNINIYNKLCLI